MHRHIKQSSKKSLTDNISKRLLELQFKSNHSIISKALKYVIKKYSRHYKIMKTYWLSCRKQTDNVGSKKVIMTNKVIRQVSKRANCIAENSRFLTKRSNEKSVLDKINPTLFIYQT